LSHSLLAYLCQVMWALAYENANVDVEQSDVDFSKSTVEIRR